MFEIDGSCGAIIFARCMDAGRIREAALVFCQRARVEAVQFRAPSAEFFPQIIKGIGTNQFLGKIKRLDQEKPVIVRRGKSLIRPGIHRLRRRNVQHGDSFNSFRVIHAQAVRDTSAAVVSGEAKTRESKSVHQLEHVIRHRAFGIWGMRGIARGFVGIAITTQIRADNRELSRQQRCDAMPHGMRLRVTMQQEQGRSVATNNAMDCGGRRANPVRGKPRKKRIR